MYSPTIICMQNLTIMNVLVVLHKCNCLLIKKLLYHFKAKEYLNSDLPYVMMEEIREVI